MTESTGGPVQSAYSSMNIGPTLLAIVISSPSGIQATPSAATILVWNRDHGSRSIRAGISLRIAGPLVVALPG
jgi:hypothetical protein